MTLSDILEVGKGKELFNILSCQVLPESWEQYFAHSLFLLVQKVELL